MKTRVALSVALVAACVLAFGSAPAAAADDAACGKCHSALARGKVVHAAVEMGCATCHAPVDASVVPHRWSGTVRKGLAAEPPALCRKCHERALFEGKVVHAPVESGQCLGCHDPHSSPNTGLLKNRPAKVCLDCHPEIAKAPHVVAGFARSGHPIGNENKEIRDPLRPGKIYYCAACHEPHRSGLPKLIRFPEKGMAACQKCHRM